MKRPPGFTLVELLIVIAIISILASLIVPIAGHALKKARTAKARALIENCAIAITGYDLDMATYPPGDGTGSAELYKSISTKGPRGKVYLHLQPDALINGDIANPALPGEILYYRRNDPKAPPGAKNPGSYDLWGSDAWGLDKGVNNWSH